MGRPNIDVDWQMANQEFTSRLRKVAHRNNASIFFKMGRLIFTFCFYSLRHPQKIYGPEAVFIFFEAKTGRRHVWGSGGTLWAGRCVVCCACATRKKTPLAASQASCLRTHALPVSANNQRLSDCLLVVTSQPASMRQRVVQEQNQMTPRFHESCANGNNVRVHHFHPLLTVARCQMPADVCEQWRLCNMVCLHMMLAISTLTRTRSLFCHRINARTTHTTCNSRVLHTKMQGQDTGRPTLRGTMSSPERSHRNHRFVVDRGIFLLPRPWAAILSTAKSSFEERTFIVLRMLVNTCVLRLWCMDLMYCAWMCGVKCGKYVVLSRIFGGGSFFIKRNTKMNMFRLLLDSSSPHDTFQEKWMFDAQNTRRKRGSIISEARCEPHSLQFHKLDRPWWSRVFGGTVYGYFLSKLDLGTTSEQVGRIISLRSFDDHFLKTTWKEDYY